MYLKKLFVFSISFIIFSTSGFASETINLGNTEWPPFQSANLKHHGIATRIIKEAFGLVNIKINYKFYSWNRCISLVKSGKIDGAFVASINPEREKYSYFSDKILTGGVVFFHLKSNKFEWKNVNDLKNYSVGGVLGSNFGNEYKNAEKQGIVKTHRVPKEEILIKMLLKKRINVALLEMQNGYDIINKSFKSSASKLTHNPKFLTSYTLHLMLSKKVKKNIRLISEFNKGLTLLKKSGKFAKYIEENRKGLYKK
ncbi:MAG: ABC transporter substrate-binding protein [Desulfobacterales bacterium]|nr:ABC transporter substrate-binding protein [Desulfobacterales bacterium]MCP4163840.1 ABC transporter substrate-binding protein [Deltaproteobacteria bacterium]